jgi:hypothetical protein
MIGSDAERAHIVMFGIQVSFDFLYIDVFFLFRFGQKSLKFWLSNNRGSLFNKSDFSTLNSSVQDPSINKQKI